MDIKVGDTEATAPNSHAQRVEVPSAAEAQVASAEAPKTQVSRRAEFELHASVVPLTEASLAEDAWIPIGPPEPRIPQFAFTQAGNAERLIARFGHTLRYCHTWGRWLFWNGQRWIPDNKKQIDRLAIQTVRYIPEEANGLEDTSTRQRLLGWAGKSERQTELRAMVELAQSMEQTAIASPQLDRDPYLFNCQNGTVDLRTGELRKPNPLDLITKLSPVEYAKDAASEVWLRFLRDIFAGDRDLIAFTQRVLGCTLTGVPEEAVFFFVGNGANGKTTLLEVFRHIMGDYAGVTDINVLMQNATNNDQLYATAALEGRRFVTASETREGQNLNEARVKLLTGRQRIPARHPYGGPFEYDPQFKLFVDANHEPVIQGTDHGIWRRMQVMPFNVRFADEPKGAELPKDPNLPNKLKAEAPGILAWAVQGCLKWHQQGLRPPTKVQETVAAYREKMDVVAEFIGENCVVQDSAESLSNQLYQQFVLWSKQRGEYRPSLSSKSFGSNLEQRGFTGKHTNRGTVRRGLRLRPSGMI